MCDIPFILPVDISANLNSYLKPNWKWNQIWSANLTFSLLRVSVTRKSLHWRSIYVESRWYMYLLSTRWHKTEGDKVDRCLFILLSRFSFKEFSVSFFRITTFFLLSFIPPMSTINSVDNETVTEQTPLISDVYSRFSFRKKRCILLTVSLVTVLSCEPFEKLKEDCWCWCWPFDSPCCWSVCTRYRCCLQGPWYESGKHQVREPNKNIQRWTSLMRILVGQFLHTY